MHPFNLAAATSNVRGTASWNLSNTRKPHTVEAQYVHSLASVFRDGISWIWGDQGLRDSLAACPNIENTENPVNSLPTTLDSMAPSVVNTGELVSGLMPEQPELSFIPESQGDDMITGTPVYQQGYFADEEPLNTWLPEIYGHNATFGTGTSFIPISQHYQSFNEYTTPTPSYSSTPSSVMSMVPDIYPTPCNIGETTHVPETFVHPPAMYSLEAERASTSGVPSYNGDGNTNFSTPGAGPSVMPVPPEARWTSYALDDGYQVKGTFRESPYWYSHHPVQYSIPLQDPTRRTEADQSTQMTYNGIAKGKGKQRFMSEQPLLVGGDMYYKRDTAVGLQVPSSSCTGTEQPNLKKRVKVSSERSPVHRRSRRRAMPPNVDPETVLTPPSASLVCHYDGCGQLIEGNWATFWRHLLGHGIKRNHPCKWVDPNDQKKTKCGMSCKGWSSLMRHVIGFHGKAFNVKCPLCRKKCRYDTFIDTQRHKCGDCVCRGCLAVFEDPHQCRRHTTWCPSQRR